MVVHAKYLLSWLQAVRALTFTFTIINQYRMVQISSAGVQGSLYI